MKKKSTLAIQVLICLFTSIFAFLSLFFKDDEDETDSVFIINTFNDDNHRVRYITLLNKDNYG